MRLRARVHRVGALPSMWRARVESAAVHTRSASLRVCVLMKIGSTPSTAGDPARNGWAPRRRDWPVPGHVFASDVQARPHR